MPIYMPWLSIAAAILSVIASIFANNKCIWFLPMYAALFAAFALMSFMGIIKVTRAFIFLALIPILMFVYMDWYAADNNEDGLSNYVNQRLIFKAVFLEEPKLSQSSNEVICTGVIRLLELVCPEQKAISGKARLIIVSNKNRSLQFKTGQVVQIDGRIKNICREQVPWLASLEISSRRKGIFYRVWACARDIRVIDSTEIENAFINESNKFIDHLRQHISNLHLRYLGTKAGSLLASMVLGDRAVTLDDDILNAFRKIGLSHIVAASGFNLTIVTIITYWLLRKMFAQRLIVTSIVCLNVILYAILAGLSASIVRSAIACLLLLLMRLYYRKSHSLAALAIVFLINLIADPSVTMDLGAQLSYAAVTGIILGAESLTKVFCFGSDSKIVKLFAASLAVILLAQMAVLPIQLYHFWQVSFLFLPANIIIDPLVSPITIIGFMSSFMGLLDLGSLSIGSHVCQLLDAIAYIPLAIIIFIAEKLSASNLFSINTGQPNIMALIFYYLSLVVLLLNLGKNKHCLASLILFFAGLVFLFYKPGLKEPVLIFLPESVVVISNRREAICFGEANLQTNKILSFYGAALVPKKYDSDKIFRFKLSDKSEIAGNEKTQTQDTSFLLSLTAKDDNLSKKYIVCLNKSKATSSMFLAEFSKELLGIVDVKISCPQKSVCICVLTR